MLVLMQDVSWMSVAHHKQIIKLLLLQDTRAPNLRPQFKSASAFERLKLQDSFNEGPQCLSICKRVNTSYC